MTTTDEYVADKKKNFKFRIVDMQLSTEACPWLELTRVD
jgi:hypothetical protein